MIRKKDEDVQKLCIQHENLVNIIVHEEENLIQSHRKHLDGMVEFMKDEMKILNEVSQSSSTIQDYLSKLEEIIAKKLQSISNLKNLAINFHDHLKEEQAFSKMFYEQQNEVLDVFCLDSGNDKDKKEGIISNMEIE